MRAEMLYNGTKVIHAKTLLIGDQEAVDFGRRRMHIHVCAPTPVGQLANLLPGTIYLGAEVKNVIIWAGGEYLKGEMANPEALLTGVEWLVRSLAVFRKRLIVVTPPSVPGKDEECKATYKGMAGIALDWEADLICPPFSRRKQRPKEEWDELLEAELAKIGLKFEKKPQKAAQQSSQQQNSTEKSMEEMVGQQQQRATSNEEQRAKKVPIRDRISIVAQER